VAKVIGYSLTKITREGKDDVFHSMMAFFRFEQSMVATKSLLSQQQKK
jgi:hypothetical protein